MITTHTVVDNTGKTHIYQCEERELYHAVIEVTIFENNIKVYEYTFDYWKMTVIDSPESFQYMDSTIYEDTWSGKRSHTDIVIECIKRGVHPSTW